MEGGGVCRIFVTECEVHTHSEVHLTTTHHVIQEGIELGHLT